MMAKMFYTLDETRASLGKTEEDIKQLTREGRLREFRDGPRLMFKADQVEQLKAELGGGNLDQVDLGPSDSGAPIGLVDSRGASGSAVGISLSDNEASGVGMGMSGSGLHMQMKDDTALAGDLGLSGSVGGMPSPARVGGTMSGTGLTGSMAGGTGVGRGGINVFSADDSIENADPSAQTAITPQDQVNLEGVGSGSGLLDLTRESDDTSLGAELLDEIAPGTGKASRPGRRAAVDSGIAPGAEGGGRVVTPPPVYVEAADPLAPALGGAAFAAAVFVLLGGMVLMSATLGTRPALVNAIAGTPTDNRSIWIIFGIGAALALVFGVVGMLVGKRR
jgi:hypothetical protein